MGYWTKYESPLGMITLASDGENLTGLWFDGQKYYMGKYQNLEEKDDLDIFTKTKNWLDEYFAKMNPSLEGIPLKPEGTDFQQKVWKELLKIPYGEVTIYGKISETLHNKSGQANGSADGRNPISILIPCHRVISKNGSLTGYAGGVEKKVHLLELEHVNMEKMYVPKKGTAL